MFLCKANVAIFIFSFLIISVPAQASRQNVALLSWSDTFGSDGSLQREFITKFEKKLRKVHNNVRLFGFSASISNLNFPIWAKKAKELNCKRIIFLWNTRSSIFYNFVYRKYIADTSKEVALSQKLSFVDELNFIRGALIESFRVRNDSKKWDAIFASELDSVQKNINYCKLQELQCVWLWTGGVANARGGFRPGWSFVGMKLASLATIASQVNKNEVALKLLAGNLNKIYNMDTLNVIHTRYLNKNNREQPILDEGLKYFEKLLFSQWDVIGATAKRN